MSGTIVTTTVTTENNCVVVTDVYRHVSNTQICGNGTTVATIKRAA